MQLGGRGIRDLASVKGGLLVLAGPGTGGQYLAHAALHLEAVVVSGTNQ